MPNSTLLLSGEPTIDEFNREVIAGLAEAPKTLPTKYLYDERGSKLFDQICELPEYYLTRTELEIMKQYGGEMTACMGSCVVLIELGSGSSVKTRILLDRLESPATYIPVDISRDHLQESARSIARAYPDVEVRPVCADFTSDFDLPNLNGEPARRIVYLPGSTIGNFPQQTASRMLQRMAKLCGPGGGALIGIDLQKNVQTIENAYNDASGVTAEFNLNLLLRINRELGGNFDLDAFVHQAPYLRECNRIEMRLVSQNEQVVTVGGKEIEFAENEHIRTEYSHKYTVDSFARLASAAGLRLEREWTDPEHAFAVLYFTR